MSEDRRETTVKSLYNVAYEMLIVFVSTSLLLLLLLFTIQMSSLQDIYYYYYDLCNTNICMFFV